MEFQHVDPQAAVDIHEDVKSNFSLGIHWGTFNLSYEVSTKTRSLLVVSVFTIIWWKMVYIKLGCSWTNNATN